MKRRELITLLGGAAAAWPLAARAQQQALPVVAYLDAGAPESNAHLVASFRKGLNETGYAEGRNLRIEYRWAMGSLDRLPELASDLVRRRPSVIVTPGNASAALAVKAATATIPIVFSTGANPVQVGLVASLNRPGANATGITFMAAELAAKRLGLLHELLPRATHFAVLMNPTSALTQSMIPDLEAAAGAIGRQIEFFMAGTNREIDTALASLEHKRFDGLLVSPDTLFLTRRVQIATLAARYLVPSLFGQREYAAAGGLMSYGASYTEEYRLVGSYAGRVLNGEKPADLPVMQATKFEFVINLQTAKLLNLTIPPTLLALTDEVIE
jgi:putative ABC transport system substrate-binding protein